MSSKQRRYMPLRIMAGIVTASKHPSSLELASDKPDVRKVAEWDYNRLKRLEQQGLDDLAEMRAEAKLTPENVCWFINQLSPWNLKTTGLAVLETYVKEASAEHQPLNRRQSA